MRKVTLIANGAEGSAAEVRATRIGDALDEFDVDVLCRQGSRLADAGRFAAAARRADVVYAVDLASAPLLGALFRSSSATLVVDTGDAPSAFLRVVDASRAEVAAARLMEAYAYRAAGAFVVRGAHHPRFLREQGCSKDVHVVPDGVDLDAFRLVDGDGLRERLGLTDAFTIGVQGHFTWHARLGGGLGWELLHAIALRPDRPFHAVLKRAGHPPRARVARRRSVQPARAGDRAAPDRERDRTHRQRPPCRRPVVVALAPRSDPRPLPPTAGRRRPPR